jgi:CheY-like chemotaxis protein
MADSFKILVAEDNPRWRDRLKKYLETEGHTVETAISYGEALGKLLHGDFDLAIVDLGLGPGLENVDGMELLADVKDEQTPAIVVTGRGTVESARRAFEYFNVVQFLAKANFEPERFIEYVRDALTSQSADIPKERTLKMYNLADIAELLNEHSEQVDVKRLLEHLRAKGSYSPELESYEDLAGTSKFEKILRILSIMRKYGESKVRLVCDIMQEIRPEDDELREGIKRLCQSEPNQKKVFPRDRSASGGSASATIVIKLILGSLVFAGLFFAIVATFRWAIGRPIEPWEFVIFAVVAVILALLLYPFILVLLNVLSPQMAQDQFNRLHSFVESSFPALLSFLDRFSRFFKPSSDSN